MIINNMPDYAYNHKFIVYRVVDGENWFYGAYDDVSKAMAAMVFCGGMIAEVKDVNGGECDA